MNESSIIEMEILSALVYSFLMYHLAFCLFKYTPYGGLERNLIRMASLCQAHGHRVDIYTMRWQGEKPSSFNIIEIPTKGLTNHGRCQSFVNQLQTYLRKKVYDCVISCNRMPGLNLYYAGDVCYVADVKVRRRFFYRLTPRYRTYAAFERAVFSTKAKTHILSIVDVEKTQWQVHYGTSEARFHDLPPGVARDRQAPENFYGLRQSLREQFSVAPHQKVLLFIGSDFKRKGLERVLRAMAALPKEQLGNTLLWVIGNRAPAKFLRISQHFGIDKQVKFLGAIDQVPDYLFAADILVHPASQEATGGVIVEALAAGLPVLTTENCGFSYYVEKSRAGYVMPMPFSQVDFNRVLLKILTSHELLQWQKNALKYSKTADIYSRIEKAVAVIEQLSRSHCHQLCCHPDVGQALDPAVKPRDDK